MPLLRMPAWPASILAAGALLAGAAGVRAADIAPRVGVNMATLGFSDEARLLRFETLLEGEMQLDNQPRFGLVAGVDLDWTFGTHVAIATGASVSMQGGSLRGDELLHVAQAPNVAVRTIVEFDYELAYLNVPLTLRLSTPWAVGNVYVAAGPLLGVLVHDTVTQSIRTTAVDLAFEPVPAPDVPGTTYSVLMAAGFDVPLRHGHGFLELTFAQGLTPALETTASEEVRQRVLGIGTGIRY
jgi:hypothetical protein